MATRFIRQQNWRRHSLPAKYCIAGKSLKGNSTGTFFLFIFLSWFEGRREMLQSRHGKFPLNHEHFYLKQRWQSLDDYCFRHFLKNRRQVPRLFHYPWTILRRFFLFLDDSLTNNQRKAVKKKIFPTHLFRDGKRHKANILRSVMLSNIFFSSFFHLLLWMTSRSPLHFINAKISFS